MKNSYEIIKNLLTWGRIWTSGPSFSFAHSGMFWMTLDSFNSDASALKCTLLDLNFMRIDKSSRCHAVNWCTLFTSPYRFFPSQFSRLLFNLILKNYFNPKIYSNISIKFQKWQLSYTVYLQKTVLVVLSKIVVKYAIQRTTKYITNKCVL